MAKHSRKVRGHRSSSAPHSEAIRNGEDGKVECLRQDGKLFASVLIHHCGPVRDEDALADAATILSSRLGLVIACYFAINGRRILPRITTVERPAAREFRTILPCWLRRIEVPT